MRVLRLSLVLCTLSLLASAAHPTPPPPDVIDEALARVGMTRADLGYRPKGYWNRFPDPDAATFKLRAFDDLFSEPLKSYDYSRTMANAAGRYCDPAFGTGQGERREEALYHLVYTLGVDRFVGGFRNYSANLSPAPASTEPLRDALGRVYAAGGRHLDSPTFGQRSPWPAPASPDDAALLTVPTDLQQIVANTLGHLLEAAHWRDLALRNCDGRELAQVFAIRDLGTTQGDGQVYYPAVQDVAGQMDWQSMGYAWLKVAAAAGELRQAAATWVAAHPREAARVHLEIPTPFGRILILGTGNQAITGDPVFLLLDLGGDDRYLTSVGATASLQMPVSLAVDLGGNDQYGAGAPLDVAYGAGILGCGLLWDAVGDDQYLGRLLSQGAGQLGCGVLYDEGDGRDLRTAEASSQGTGFLGLGFCIDGGGDDQYTLSGGEGQGFGGVGGIGVCIDRAGNDRYYAEPDASKAPGRADYHSEFAINVSNAQGVGAGRRGDGSDGHAWAGGLGAILDLAGDDHYISGNWSLGTGYWFGIGVAWDGGGNDIYESVYFTQGSGAHFCLGVLIDEGEGQDVHRLNSTAGAALGFGWDFTNALFVDGGGDDVYSAKLISFGCAQIRSNAFFLELGGNDLYEYQPGLLGFGAVDWRDDYAVPHPISPYMSEAASFGFFCDFGGEDRYQPTGELGTAQPLPMHNRQKWLIPSADSPRFGWSNFGVGMDREGGSWWDRDRWFVPAPSATP